MRVAACICVYHEPKKLLSACLKQLPQWVEKILVLVSEKPWNGVANQHAGETMTYLVTHRDPRLEVWRMDWREEHVQRDWGMGRLYEYDWVLIVDADEFYSPEDWEKLYLTLAKVGRESPCIVADGMRTYWKDFEHIWEPSDTHKPVIAARPDRAVFFDKRCISEQMMYIAPVTMEHLSWVKTDEEVREKISTWSHAHDFDSEKWYRDVWLSWTPEMTNIRPYGMERETRATKYSLPDSIRSLFDV